MSYRIQVRDDRRAYPIIACDHCGQPIAGDGEGSATWLETGTASTVGNAYDVKHTHKLCSDAFEAANPPGPTGHWMWNEIDHHLYMLLLNCCYNAKEGKRKAELLASLA